MSPRGGGRVLSALGTPDVLVIAAAVGLPWFFGGVGLGSMRAASACIAVASGWELARRGPSGLGFDRRLWWLFPAFALGAFAFFQTAPLPRGIVAALSPEAAKIQARAFGPGAPDANGWLRQIESDAQARVPEASGAPPADPAVAPGAGGPPQHYRLSLEPSTTFERAMWFTALLLAFLVVSARTVDRSRATGYQTALYSFFAVLALVGLAHVLTSPASVLWILPAPEMTRPMGPYVNPTHFAGVMELGIPWMLGFGLAPLARRRLQENIGPAHVAALAAAGVGAVAALVAASKTATMTIACSTVVLIVVAARRGRHGRMLVAGSVLALVVLAGVALAGPLRGRVADFFAVEKGSATTTDRLLLARIGRSIVEDYPLAGSGFGAFRVVIPKYLPRGDSGHWLQMHNDYYEVVVAGGLVGAILAAWLAVAFTVRVIRAVRSEAERGKLLPALGLSFGLASLATHEAVDFNLQIPANALLFVVAAAFALGPLARAEEPA